MPPEWLNGPSDRDIMSGDDVEFSCTANGKPKPVIKWQKFNGKINIAIKPTKIYNFFFQCKW